MHIKHIHCMIEGLAEYGKCMIEAGVGNGNVNLCDAGQIVDMIKDLANAEYHSLISKAMKESEEEDEAEEKYIKRMLKEERADEYKRMREQYGDEEGERRFYDNYRYANGRFAPKGRGSYMPRSSGRRGYVEPPYYHMMPVYDDYNAEEMRDIDRHKGRMYFSQPMGNMGAGKADGGNYSDGYNDGQTKGYSEGYEKGMNDGRRNGNNSQSRFDKVKRGYEETKEAHKGNTAEDKQTVMKEAERLVNVGMDAIEEALEGSAPEVINMVKAKMTGRIQKLS